MENNGNTSIAEPRHSVRSLLAKDSYKARFNEILGKNAGQFMASIVQSANSYALRNCDPNSVIAAAIVAASLNLPIDRNLGFAHIVPYAGTATFQMGYKGFIQLGLRSGQFASMRDVKVNKEAFIGYDKVTGDPLIDWEKLDETKEIIGYGFAWRLTNGFAKIVYWTKEQVDTHAKRFSQAYKAKKKDSPWITDFDSMALKTVIKAALSKWAPLSLEMQQAIVRDESAQKDPDSAVIYSDGINLSGESEEVKKPIFGTPPGSEKNVTPPADTSNPDLESAEIAREPLIEKMKEAMLDNDVSEAKLFKYAHEKQLVPKDVDELWSLATAKLVLLSVAIPTLKK